MSRAAPTRLWRWTKGMMLRRMPLMLTCRQAEAFMGDYIDGTLPTGKRLTFEFHLRLCPECRDYLAAYRHAMALGKAVFDDPNAPVPDDMPEDLIAAILDARDA